MPKAVACLTASLSRRAVIACTDAAEKARDDAARTRQLHLDALAAVAKLEAARNPPLLKFNPSPCSRVKPSPSSSFVAIA